VDARTAEQVADCFAKALHGWICNWQFLADATARIDHERRGRARTQRSALRVPNNRRITPI
jgi:hypothetical protein